MKKGFIIDNICIILRKFYTGTCIILTPDKTQHLQYDLTRDFMLYYHSYQIESINLWSRYQGNILLVQIKQSR